MKNKFGFTLVELLIAITIGMLVVGFGLVSLNNFYQQQKVETVSQELLSNLILARNYAVTNQFPAGSSSDTDRVAVTIDSEGLITAGTQTSGNQDTGDIFFSKDISSDDVSIIPNNVIKFSVTDGRSIGGTVSIIISGNTTKEIRIDESGLIYEK